MIENILGSKTKIKILQFILKNEDFSIKQLSNTTNVDLSTCIKDINDFISSKFVVKNNNQYSVNKNNEHYDSIFNLFFKENIFKFGLSSRRKKELQKMMPVLLENKSAVIVMHHNADPDSLGSAVALSRGLSSLGIKTDILAPAGISKQSANILKTYPYPILTKIEKVYPIYIVVDVCSTEQIGNLDIPKESKLFIIDHHKKGNLYDTAFAKITDMESHSTAKIVYQILTELKIDVTKEISFFLLCGLVADTAFFKIADKSDFEITVQLLELNKLEDVFSILWVTEDVSSRIAKVKSFKRLDAYKFKDNILVFSRTGSFESQIALTLVRSACNIAIVFNTKNDDIRISARMRHDLKGKLDLVQILKPIEKLINGSAGGHDMAASANGKNPKCIRDVKSVLIKELENKLKCKSKALE